MVQSMYSLPSASQMRAPRARSANLGAIPRTYCPAPLASVWVAAGIRSTARAYNASERAITGSVAAEGVIAISSHLAESDSSDFLFATYGYAPVAVNEFGVG